MEQEQNRWQEIKAEIVCPLKPDTACRKIEGIRERKITLGHSAVIYTAECIACGAKASGWE